LKPATLLPPGAVSTSIQIMVDAFLSSFDDFVAITERYLDIKRKPKHHHVIANEAIQPRNLS
jgi:hypothetical protein